MISPQDETLANEDQLAARLCEIMHCEAGQITLHWARQAVREIRSSPPTQRVLEAILDVRARNAANFDRSGAAWEAYDQAVRDCHAAVEALSKSDSGDAPQ